MTLTHPFTYFFWAFPVYFYMYADGVSFWYLLLEKIQWDFECCHVKAESNTGSCISHFMCVGHHTSLWEFFSCSFLALSPSVLLTWLMIVLLFWLPRNSYAGLIGLWHEVKELNLLNWHLKGFHVAKTKRETRELGEAGRIKSHNMGFPTANSQRERFN